MAQKKNIIITGTHHTPAIELIRLLKLDKTTDWNISYIAHLYHTESHINHTIIPKLKVPFYNLDCGKFDRTNLLKTIIGIPKIFFALIQSIRLISKLKPDIIVSFGGYVSVPVIMAGFLKNIPSITHEQTLTISLSTKINSYFVNKIALSFDNFSDYSQLPANKTFVTGNLIRQQIFKSESSMFESLNLLHKPILYVTGGNQGSLFINQFISALLPKLDKFNIVHQTGNYYSDYQHLTNLYPNYHPFEFIDSEDLGWLLHHLDIIVSRAGANTCQEIDLLGLKAILIPLEKTQQNEQFINAQWLQKKHPQSTVVFKQSEIDDASFLNKVNQLLSLKLPKSKVNITANNHPLINLIHEISH